MNNLRKFSTLEDYQEAELVKPAVSLIASDDSVFFDQKEAEPEAFGGLTVIYNIDDASNEVTLFNGGGGGSSESESESGGGGALPTRMIIDGNEETPINTWRFSTSGEHTVQYEFNNGAIPEGFFGFIHEITEVEVGSEIDTIGEYVFEECGITSVTLGDSVTSINNGAFQGCTSLESIVIPSGVTTIETSVFSGCTSLSSVTIPDSVTSIGIEAFAGCTSLDTVEIGSACNSIGDYAFKGCSTLSVFIIDADTPPSLGYDILADTANDLVIYVPSGAGSTYESLWTDYASKIQENVG